MPRPPNPLATPAARVERVVDRAPARAETPTADDAMHRRAMELIWYDPMLPSLLRAHPDWSQLQDERGPAEERQAHKGRPSPAQPIPVSERQSTADVWRVLAKARPSDAGQLDELVMRALDVRSHAVERPALLLEGELSVHLDELEGLKVMADIAKSLRPGDRPMTELLTLVEHTVESPLRHVPAIVRGLAERLNRTWAAGSQQFPAEYLSEHAAQTLLATRRYDRRELLGQHWLRARLRAPTQAHGRAVVEVVAYLPAELATKLPLFERFSVRVIGIAVPRQEQQEPAWSALCVAALARVLAPPLGRGAT
jgi:hypothetical protein